MPGFRVFLFGKLRVERDGVPVESLVAIKAQELFCHLLFNRHQSRTRETLSESLWADQPPEKSRKNLRQALWLLQSALTPRASHSPLVADSKWIQFAPNVDFWVDAEEFERVYNQFSTLNADEFSKDDFTQLQRALSLYKGNFLEGWYQDWCIIERERYQRIYLMMLGKLVQYCEVHGDFETGLAYGAEILRSDRAYERAHRQMMRLYLLSGDRSQALRQYARCVESLNEELGVSPSKQTTQLYEQIRAGSYGYSASVGKLTGEQDSAALKELLNHLELYAGILSNMQTEVFREIVEIENRLGMHQ